MKKTILSIILLHIAIINAFSQYEQNYWGAKLRNMNSLGQTYKHAVSLCKKYNNDSAYKVMDKLVDSLFIEKNWEKLLLARNELSTMFIQHNKYEEAINYLNKTVSLLRYNIDTLSTEYLYTYKLFWWGYMLTDNLEQLNNIQNYRYKLVESRRDIHRPYRGHYALDIDTYDEISDSYSLLNNQQKYFECADKAFYYSDKIRWKYKTNILSANLGSKLLEFGYYNQALTFLENAWLNNPMEIFYDTVIAITQLNNLAVCLNNLNEPRKSITIQTKNLSFIKNNTHPSEEAEIQSHISLGESYEKLSLIDSSKYHLREAYRLSVNYKLPLSQISSATSLAKHYNNINKSDSCEHWFRKANLLSKTIKNDQRVSLYFKVEYAQYLIDIKDYKTAIDIIDECLKNTYLSNPYNNNYFARRTNPIYYNEHILTLNSLKIIALIKKYTNAHTKNFQSIIELYNDYSNIVNAMLLETTVSEKSKKIKINNRQIINEVLDYLIKFSDNQPEIDNYIYLLIANIKSIDLSNHLYENELTRLMELNDASDSIYQNLKEKIFQLERTKDLLLFENNMDSLKTLNDELITCKRKVFLKEVQLKFQSKQIIQGQNKITKSSVNNVSNIMPPEKAIIEYHLTDENLILALLSDEGLYIKNVKFKNISADIEKQIRSIKTLQSNPNNLFDYLIKPHLSQLNNKKNLTLILDNDLYKLPFETIKDNNGKYLINTFSINYSNSLAIWCKNFNKNIYENTSFIGIAPVFSGSDKDITFSDNLRTSLANDTNIYRNEHGIAELPNTKSELLEIKSIIEKNSAIKPTILLNTEATKKRILQKLNHADIIHFATHGVVNITNPYLSGLVLSPECQSIDQTDILYNYEVYSQNVNANLVVLSACKTGTGKIIEGEGVMALPRGFIYAGVPNVIASLWKVHDEKTKDLMVAFYKHLLEDKVSYAEALRLAKLDCIEKGFLPVDWAGFVLIGN